MWHQSDMVMRRPLVALALVVLALSSAAGAQAKPEADRLLQDIQKVVELLVGGDYQGVVSVADELFTRHPLDERTLGVLLMKAESQRHLSRVPGAIDSYQRALPFIERLNNVAQRRFVMVYFRLATLYRVQGRHDTAIRFVEAGLTREPQNAYYQILLGQLLGERGDRARALKHFEAVLASPTPNPEERVVLRIKIDRLRTGAPAGTPLHLPSPHLHAGLSLGIVPLNRPAATVSVADVCLLLESKWLVRCAVLPPVDVDEAALLNPQRGQYDADRILEELARRYPAHQRPHRIVIALTGRDIFGPDTNYVFSWQAPPAGLGVLSTYRFTAGLEDFYEPTIIGTRRLGIQFLSTSGSLLGFARPTRPECPLAYPHDFREFALKSSKLCESTIEQRDALLRKTGGPTTPFDARKIAEIQRVYATYSFD
jgi:predicted Zn-dependent protease